MAKCEFRFIICAVLIALSCSSLASQRVPIVAIGTDSDVVLVGSSAQISWASAYSDSCIAEGRWNGARPKEGVAVTPTLKQSGNYRFGIRCTNPAGSTTEQVLITAVSLADPLYESAWISEPTVVPFMASFAQPNIDWRLRVRLDRTDVEQTLLSYDEDGQVSAGHTTVSVDRNGYVIVRHQASAEHGGSFRTRSRTQLEPGQDYEIRLLLEKGRGLKLFVDGQQEASSPHGFGTDKTRRDLVLGASCSRCKPGTTAPLQKPLWGGMSFTAMPFVAQSATADDAVATAPESLALGHRKLLFTGESEGSPVIYPHDPAFSRDQQLWKVDFEVLELGRRQTLFSYDELGQSSAGQTTLSVSARGRIRVRHQGEDGNQLTLSSQSRVVAGQNYTAHLLIEKDGALELYLNGNREARTVGAWGTTATIRPLIVGGNCGRCKARTTAPITYASAGAVAVAVYSAPSEEASVPRPISVATQTPVFEPQFDSGLLSGASVVRFQEAFSQRNAVWRVHFKLNTLGNIQGLFSYDEVNQPTAGNTS
ncbi:MAG: hypothetical protein AAGG11_00440, partial [Pseudomonadota bacterium]